MCRAARAIEARGPGSCRAGPRPRDGCWNAARGRFTNRGPVYESSAAKLRLGRCGPALPSPTSGGPARFFQGTLQILRQWRTNVDRRARHRMREGEPLGVEELTLQPEGGVAVLGIA